MVKRIIRSYIDYGTYNSAKSYSHIYASSPAITSRHSNSKAKISKGVQALFFTKKGLSTPKNCLYNFKCQLYL